MSTMETTAGEREAVVTDAAGFGFFAIGREWIRRLIRDFVALEAENVTLKQRIDGAAQIIAMRTADVTTFKQERDRALKIERLALAQVKEDMVTLEIVVAERDRLRQALERLSSNEAFDVARAIGGARDRELVMRMDFARRSLSPSETEEGG